MYAELVGYGMSGDAFHITAPTSDGDGAFRCMTAAIKRAGIQPGEIDYINAHGTSTPMGDEIELGAVQRLVGNAAGRISMSSTKSAIGHLLGAAGAVEAIFSILAMRDGVAPPTLNLDNPSGRDANRSRAACGAQARHRRGAVEFVRLWRHQCFADLPPRSMRS
jgi:3-oxoacyl-[acyl-carrier-protein] synthase II